MTSKPLQGSSSIQEIIGSQYTDTDIKLVDGVHDISRNTTLQVLVINNSNHHVNFPKGMKIGHLEPPIDDLT